MKKFGLFAKILLCSILGLLSCRNQPVVYIQIDRLKEKEIRIYYNVDGHPKLEKYPSGNLVIPVDTSVRYYTSTPFDEMKMYRDVFCFNDMNQKCYYEDNQLEKDGYTIEVYSCFANDTTGQSRYKDPYDKILIKRIGP